MKIPNASFYSKILLQTGLYFFSLLSYSQTPDTLSCMPEHHAKKVKEFSAEPVVKGKIVFLGNSITEMGPWQGLRGDTGILNRGIGGDISYSILNRLNEVLQRKPSKLFMMVGINDLAKGIEVKTILSNCRLIIEKVKSESPETQVYLQSLLPVRPDHASFPQGYDKQEKILHLNACLKVTADSLAVNFIPLYPLFADKNGVLNSRYTIDGLHLNQKGYKLWVNYLKNEGYIP